MTSHAHFDALDVLPTEHEKLADQTIFELADNDQTLTGTHTTPCLVFSLPDDTDLGKDQIIAHLCTGLQNFVTCIPLVAGQLRNTADRLSILRHNHQPMKLHVHHLDLDPSVQSYQTLAYSGFSSDFFTSNASLLTPPDSNLAGIRREDGCPVAVFQANFIRGGLILLIAYHHICGDAKSIDHILSLWAASTKAATERKPLPAWNPSLDRSYFTASSTPSAAETEELKKHVSGFSFHPLSSDEEAGPPADPPALPAASISMYHFATASCTKLKEACWPTEPGRFVSSYDCVAALTWRCMLRAQVPYHKMDLQKSTTNFSHAVGLRANLGRSAVPIEYLGNGFLLSDIKRFPVGELISEGGLTKAARAIRQCTLNVKESSMPEFVRARKGVEGREEMRWVGGPGNVLVTSWTEMQAFTKCDFGFGLPVSLRLLMFLYEGVVVMLPASRGVDGKSDGLDVCVSLERGCQERLEADEEYRAYCSLLR